MDKAHTLSPLRVLLIGKMLMASPVLVINLNTYMTDVVFMEKAILDISKTTYLDMLKKLVTKSMAPDDSIFSYLRRWLI